MNSELYWLVSNQILYWKLLGSIPASEISTMSRLIIATCNESRVSKIHLMIDASNTTGLNHSDSKACQEFANLARQEWMGQVVAIVHNVRIQMSLNAMSSAFGMKWKTVSSMRQAMRSLQQSDSSIQTIPALNPDLMISRS